MEEIKKVLLLGNLILLKMVKIKKVLLLELLNIFTCFNSVIGREGLGILSQNTLHFVKPAMGTPRWR